MKNMQRRHHGIVIPAHEQPRCPACSGWMSLHIMYPRDECHARWYCLDEQRGGDCPGGSVPFAEWYKRPDLSPGIREHFATVGLSYSELRRAELEAAGYEAVAGDSWGGGSWGEPQPGDVLAWTGHRGQCREWWRKS